MKSIVCINTTLPTISEEIEFHSDRSLRDFDIVIFNPIIPFYDRINFSGGGSCISIEGNTRFSKASAHWLSELQGALEVGKTIFVILNAHEEDRAATDYTSPSKGTRTYNARQISNYDSIPAKLSVKNSRGRNIIVKESSYKRFYENVREFTEYRVVLDSAMPMKTIFLAKDGAALDGVVRFKELPGALVLLPYFDFGREEFIEESDTGEEFWNKKAIQISHALVDQLISIDRVTKGSSEVTPAPEWLSGFDQPRVVDEIEGVIAEIDVNIEKLKQQREEHLIRKRESQKYLHLLYETGKPLERAIEKVLQLLGYTVETLRIGDLEIDHVIVGPSGVRMIGESEGKDSNAIDISKFRQLESNIGEDFQREGVSIHAKGLLFGNGFRLSPPAARPEQFTQKCLTNANRLGSALIRTGDLYSVALHLLNNSDDEKFRAACRDAIEKTEGGIVVFPDPILFNVRL